MLKNPLYAGQQDSSNHAHYSHSGSNDDFFIFEGEGVPRLLDIVLVNPYTGNSIKIEKFVNYNTGSYDGGAGNDVLFMSNLGDALFLTDSLGNQVFRDIETVIAGDGDDLIILSDRDIELGDLTIIAGRGNDIVWSNVGNDTINGNLGDDIIHGGGGDDVINGGEDNDLINGGDGNDELNGDQGNDIIYGDAGDDLITGGDGDDVLYGGFGAPPPRVPLGLGNSDDHNAQSNLTSTNHDKPGVKSFGSANLANQGDAGPQPVDSDLDEMSIVTPPNDLGDDILIGGAGNDHIYGEGGDDILTGGLGADQLYGGAGSDQFVFDVIDGQVDVVHDFELGEGADVLNITDILVGFDLLTDALSDFVQLVDTGDDMQLMVSADGAGDFIHLATLMDVDTTLLDLMNNDQIVINSSTAT